MPNERNKVEALPVTRLLAELSIWSADLGRLSDEIARMDAYADIYHIDVADGHFAPAMLFFPDLAASIRKWTAKPLHVHLMVADAILQEQIRQFAAAGTDIISIHVENNGVPEALQLIHSLGLQSGLVAKVETPVASLQPFMGETSFITLLGTRIGVKGQSLDPAATQRLQETKSQLAQARRKRRIILAADGGIRENTVGDLHGAGAETVVMGSLAFNAPDLAQRMAWIRSHAIPA